MFISHKIHKNTLILKKEIDDKGVNGTVVNWTIIFEN